jgi:hypothetical protein
MFGSASPQPSSTGRNGFLALREFDRIEHGGNGDGIIDQHDTIFDQLRLWVDANFNGRSELEELLGLPSAGITSISLNYKLAARRDLFGNTFRYRAKIGTKGRSTENAFAWDVILVGEIQPERK